MSSAEPTDLKETKFLDCQLTPDEFIAHAVSLAEVEAKIERLTEERKAVAKRWADKISGEKSLSRKHRRAVATRAEKREVICTWYADYISKQMILRRDDTHEIVTVRTMTPEELQTAFPKTATDRRLPPHRDESDDEGDDAEHDA